MRGRAVARLRSCIAHRRTPASASRSDALQKLGRPFEQVESQLTKTPSRLGPRPRHRQVADRAARRRMRIRSTLGAGTMVVVRLPLAAAMPSCPQAKRRKRAHFSATAPCPESARSSRAPAPASRSDARRAWRNPARRRRAPAAAAARRRRSSDRTAPGRHSRRICVRS